MKIRNVSAEIHLTAIRQREHFDIVRMNQILGHGIKCFVCHVKLIANELASPGSKSPGSTRTTCVDAVGEWALDNADWITHCDVAVNSSS